MNFTRFRIISVLFLCGSMVLASCDFDPGNSFGQRSLASPTVAMKKTLPLTNIIATTEVLTPTDDVNKSGGLELKSSQRILINVTNTKVDLGICYPLGSTEVWEASYPFVEKQVILASNSTRNYFAPTYSPNGEWIAYIESKPIIGDLDLEKPTIPNPQGDDSIWIMRSDGSEKQRVSNLFSSFSVKDIHFCYPQSHLYPILTWSPDEKYIFFADFHASFEGNRLNYYILNVKSKESYIFNSSGWNTINGFAWLSESGHFVYADGDSYFENQITSTGINRKNAIPIPINSKLTNTSLNGSFGLNEPILISRNDSLTKISLWQLDSDQWSWSKKIEYTGNEPKLGTFWGVFNKNNNFYFINLKSFAITGPFPYKNKISDYIYLFPEIKNKSGNVVVSIIDSTTNDIWEIDPNGGSRMVQLINWVSLDPQKRYSIIDQFPSLDWSH